MRPKIAGGCLKTHPQNVSFTVHVSVTKLRQTVTETGQFCHRNEHTVPLLSFY